MRTAPGRIAAVAVVGLGMLAAGQARAANWLELNFWLSGPRYDGVMPACDDPAALEKISYAFGQKEARFWNSNLQILGFEGVRQLAYRPWAADTIPRRWCSGHVKVSDGRMRKIDYSIGEDTGEIGATFGVEFCVVGLDRNWAYNPACKMARP
jgi:hypothetical protein